MTIANTVNLNLNFGAVLSQLSNSTSLTTAEGLEKSYTANEGTQSGPFVGIGAEYVLDHLTSMPFALGLGVSAYYIDLGNISGTENPWVTPGLTDTLDYSMQASSVALMFEPRLTYTAYHLQPYILGGIGCAWNSLSNFTETTPPGGGAAASNPYGNNTESSFAYEVGAGVQYPLVANQSSGFILRFEYRYLNLGRSELGGSSGQTTNQRLTSNNISTNVVDFGLSYQFQ